MSYYGGDKAREYMFQNDNINQLLANDWLLAEPENYTGE